MYDATTGGLSANGLTQISNAQILGYSMIGQAGDADEPRDARGSPQRERHDHDRLDRGGAALERRRRAAHGPGDQVLLPPGAELVPVLRPGGAPGAEGRQPARVVHREHRPRQGVLGARHPPLLLGRRPLPEVGRLALRPVQVGARATTSASIAYHLKDGDRNQAWAGPPAGGPYIQNKAAAGNDDDRRDRVGRGRDRPGPSGRRRSGRRRSASSSSSRSRTGATSGCTSSRATAPSAEPPIRRARCGTPRSAPTS